MTAHVTKTLKIALAAVALATVGAAIPGTSTPAAAKPIKIISGKIHHPHYGRYILGGLALAGTYEASRSCYWLKVRAVRTGSDYWWDRYHACIND